PTVIPNQGYGHSGWNPALKGTFSTASTITAQYKEGTFDENAIKEIIVLGPTKMGYGEGEKLNLTGLKVIAKDDAGLQKTYEGVDVIKAAGFTIAPANETVLTKNHNGQPIKVSKVAGQDKVTGQTETTLTIHENKSAKAEDVKALNQNKVVDGKVTNEPKNTTTVTGKAKAGSTVIIKNEAGDEIGKVEKVGEEGTFTAEVTKQDEGKKVKVVVTEEGKQASDPVEATVARDANNDGKADDDANQKTATPTAKALNQGANPTATTITGKAEPGAKVVAKVGDHIVGEATAGQDGNYTIQAKQNEKLLAEDTEVKVTAQAEGKLVSDPTATVVKIDKDGNGVDDEKEQFDIKKATKVEILQNPNKMNYSVTEKNGKTPFNAKGVIIKLTDDSNKTATYTYADIISDANKGKFTLSPADKEQIGLKEDGSVNTIPFKVTVTGADTKPSVTAKENITVILDKDGNGVDDRTETTPEPNVIARNIGTDGPDGKKVPATKTTVEVKTEPNADVTIEYKDANGDTKTITGKADDQGKLTKEITPKLKDGTDVKVTVQDGEKKPTEKTVKVFDDLDGDKIPDTKAGQTERPAALASNIGKKPTFTTITGEAEKGATVTAKVANVVVGTATADKETGKYTIEAKQNNAPIKEGVKIDVTATLAPKAESLKQTVVVFNDTDGTGQPDSAKDFDVKKTTGMQVVASPDKMVYSDGDKLNLDGLKVLLTDVNGNQKIFTYKNADNSEFTNAGLSVDLKQETVLSSKDYDAQTAKDGHNGRKLVVTLDTTGNTSAEKAITGQTPTALTVNKNQSAQPTDVVAANQGDATVTKVKGKATKDAEIKITDASGQSLLPEGTTIKADANGDFTADLNKLLNPGTKVFVTATEPGKSESPKAETTVIRDKDGNWKPDTGAKLSTPVIDPIREKDEKVVVAAPKVDDKIQTIEVSDQNGKTVRLTKDPADTTGKTWIVEGSDPAEKVTENNEGKLEIPVKDKLPLNDRDQIKVTFKDGENPANEAFDKAPVQKASQTPKVDPVYTGDKSVKIADPTVADPTAKTIKVKVGDNDSMTVEKQPDGSWKVKEDPNKEVKVEDGKIVVPLDPSAKKGDVIKVSTINDSGKASPEAKVTVEDKEKSTTPEVNPVSTNDTKITGKAGPNADVVITITPKDGGTPKEINAKADKEGNFSVPADGLKDGDTIVAKATEKDKAPAESAPVTVGVDKSKLIKAIDDGDKKLEGKDPKDYTPADKKLKEAIEEGKKVKDNPDASQNDVNEKTKAIEDAIKEKEETDKALDELKKAKEELDKTIDDAEKDEKPDKAIEKGQDASDDAGTVIDNKGKDKDDKDMTSDQIKELVEKTKEENRILRLPVIQVVIDTALNDGKSIVFTTNPGRCKVTITITRKDLTEETYNTETGPEGTGSITIANPLKTGDNVKVNATRKTKDRPVPDYLDNYTSTGV
ncbi:Ig-like domain-containing protein, partial [Peptostreptococcus anaerobius]|uniref:Ig-like domain-containing protein n=1 Tax=Peptostreptococcus anaerobius TaxID=1261 RepID=UPI00321A8E7B